MSTAVQTDKRYWPLPQAEGIARELAADLVPYCERLVIAGSIRRRRPHVGDIELLCIPKFDNRPDGLFDSVAVDLLDERLNKLLADGVLAKREGANGSTAWGAKNKLAVYVPTGISVDFFSTSAEAWWNSLVLRTGGKTTNLVITTTARRRGESFEAYGSGFSRNGVHIHTTTSERDVFDYLGIPYTQPQYRK